MTNSEKKHQRIKMITSFPVKLNNLDFNVYPLTIKY